MSLQSQIESLLFVSSGPVAVNQLTRATESKPADVVSALANLQAKYRQAKDSGMMLITTNDSYQLVTSPKNAALVADFLKQDLSGDLTEPSLETLTIIAYRGPITRAELEQIRGVNCSLILRNLMMRGLITKEEGKSGLARYSASADFVRYLGLASVKDLPDYPALNKHETLDEVLAS